MSASSPFSHSTLKIIQRQNPTPELQELTGTGLPALLQRIYLARGVKSQDELQYGLIGLQDYRQLKGIDAAVELIQRAIEAGQRILIVGDFDADGATSCAVAVRGLRLLGAQDVRFVVPDRFKYGYGLTPEIVAVAAEQSPDLLITVDNGISSLDGVAAAKARGITVLITDHHLPGESLPEADAIVNPNQPGCAFPSKALAGVGVMFYVLMACRAHFRQQDWFNAQEIPEPNLAQLLDIVALGTVADVVPLDHNNRILVSQGLSRMRRGQCCVGIQALTEFAKRDLKKLTATDLGFALGPRINAAGRLDDMRRGIECLLTDDTDQARQLASELDELNRARRDIGDQMLEEAQVTLQELHLEEAQDLPFGLSLFEPSWHQGVIGILASRIKEQTHRPVIVFAGEEEAEAVDENKSHNSDTERLIKGSARSVPGVHIRDVLDLVATRHPGLITKFGGHAMAAGLSLPEAHFPAFAEAFDQAVREHVSAEDLQGKVYTDGQLQSDEISCEMAAQLEQAGPWGQAFPEPQFDGRFALIQARIVGEKHLKLRLMCPQTAQQLDAIAFFTTNENWPDQVSQVDLVYRLDINEFRGERQVQLIVQHIAPV